MSCKFIICYSKKLNFKNKNSIFHLRKENKPIKSMSHVYKVRSDMKEIKYKIEFQYFIN